METYEYLNQVFEEYYESNEDIFTDILTILEEHQEKIKIQSEQLASIFDIYTEYFDHQSLLNFFKITDNLSYIELNLEQTKKVIIIVAEAKYGVSAIIDLFQNYISENVDLKKIDTEKLVQKLIQILTHEQICYLFKYYITDNQSEVSESDQEYLDQEDLEQEEQNDSEEETIKESIQKIYKQFLTHHTTMSQTNQFSK